MELLSIQILKANVAIQLRKAIDGRGFADTA